MNTCWDCGAKIKRYKRLCETCRLIHEKQNKKALAYSNKTIRGNGNLLTPEDFGANRVFNMMRRILWREP